MTQRALAASCVGLLLAAAASTATAETFVFRDSRRPRIRGRVLVEFRDVLFVALDGQPQRFLARAELAAIIDNDGRRHDDLALGTFGPDGGDSPAAAITDVLGDVQLADSSLRDDRQPAFARAGDTIRTGESGLARLAFPSGASVKLGPESRIELPADGDGLVLRGGELFCEPDLRPLSIRLSETAEIDVAPGAVGTIRRDDEGTHVQQHRGDAQLSWGDSELSLGPGLGARLRPQTDGSYRLDADPTNPEPLRLRSAGEVVVVPAGDAHATTQDSKVEATADPVGSSGCGPWSGSKARCRSRRARSPPRPQPS